VSATKVSPNTSHSHAVQHTNQQDQCTREEWVSKSTKVVDDQGGKSTRVIDMGLPGTRHGREEILHRRARCSIVSNKANAHLRSGYLSQLKWWTTRVVSLPGW